MLTILLKMVGGFFPQTWLSSPARTERSVVPYERFLDEAASSIVAPASATDIAFAS